MVALGKTFQPEEDHQMPLTAYLTVYITVTFSTWTNMQTLSGGGGGQTHMKVSDGCSLEIVNGTPTCTMPESHF